MHERPLDGKDNGTTFIGFRRLGKGGSLARMESKLSTLAGDRNPIHAACISVVIYPVYPLYPYRKAGSASPVTMRSVALSR